MQAGCAPGNSDLGGMGTGGGTSSWPCPFTHKFTSFTPKGHTLVHSPTCSPRTGARCVPTLPALARPRWVLHSQLRSHTHVPTPWPWAPAPPPFPAPCAPPRPQFLFTVMEPPALPSRHRGGSYRGIAAAAASPVPGTGVDGFPAVRDYPTDARPRPILGTAAGNPDREKSWIPRGIGMGWEPRICCEWSVGAPAWHCQALRRWDVPALPDSVSGSGPHAQVGDSREVPCPVSRCVREPREESSPGPDPLCHIPQRRATL